MKKLLFILLVTLSCGAGASTEDDLFAKAGAAYDDGRYAEAVLLYERLLDTGASNAEIHYNLANAAFKDSDLATAVLHYRQAWHRTPRDPDIKANFTFALNAAGVAAPTPGFFKKTLQTLSIQEWILVATAAYLLLVALLILALLTRSARRYILKLCLIPITLGALAFMGWREWNLLRTQPEWVVIKTEGTALFAPIAGTTEHYKLPLGALVQQVSTEAKGWVEVSYDGKNGWITMDYIRPVSP